MKDTKSSTAATGAKKSVKAVKTTSKVKKISKINSVKKTNAVKSNDTLKDSKARSIAKLNNDGQVEGSKKFKLEKNQSKKKKKILYFDKKLKLDIIDILVLIISTAIISSLVCYFVVNYYYRSNSVVIDTELAKDNDLQSFIQTYSIIVDNFYEDVDKKGMIDAAKSGMLEHLADKYSIFLNEQDASKFEDSLNNTYEGIGVLSVENVIFDVYPNSPADKAGIKVKDEIIRVNGVDIDKKNYYKITELLKENKDGSEVVVRRDNEELTFNVSIEEVYKPSVSIDSFEKDGVKVGYISLEAFSQNSADEFDKSLNQLEEDGIEGLIIDLRSNSGGYIDTASKIASMFIEKGKVIYSLEKKDNISIVNDETAEHRDYPIVILVNSSTASASEMLTAALVDNNNAKVVGVKTYGKGKVQTIINYEGSLVKYTSSKWLRPNGDCIDEVGIIPDYEVQLEIKNNVIYDRQYEKAIEILTKK